MLWENTERGWPETREGTSCSTPESWKRGKAAHLMEKAIAMRKTVPWKSLLSNSLKAKLCYVHPRNGLNHIAESKERSCRHNRCCLPPVSSVTHLLVQFSSE